MVPYRKAVVETFARFVPRHSLARGYFRYLFRAAVAFVTCFVRLFCEDFRQVCHVFVNTESMRLVVAELSSHLATFTQYLDE